MKTCHDDFSPAEVAQMLECDETYLGAMVKVGRLKSRTSPAGDVLISAESLITFRDETWEGVRDLVRTLLDILQEQHVDLVDANIKLLTNEKRARRRRRTSVRREEAEHALSLVKGSTRSE